MEAKSYEDFDNEHRRQKRLVIIASSVIIVSLLLVLLFMSGSRAFFALKVSPKIKNDLLKEDICYLAFDSIARKNGNPLVIDEYYLSNIEKKKYEFIDFQLNDDSYRILERQGEGKCKIVISSRTYQKHDLRSFVVQYQEDRDYAFNYKVFSIYEVMLSDKDLKSEI